MLFVFLKDSFFCLVSVFLRVIFILLGMSFFTLLEQKVLGASQVRVGPFYRGFLGLLQPFSDALKLYIINHKFDVYLPTFFLNSRCVLYLVFCCAVWNCCPFQFNLKIELGFIYILFIIGVRCLPFLFISWYRNCKYRALGGLRVVSQLVSYEVSSAFCFIRICFLWFNLRLLRPINMGTMNIVSLMPVVLLFVPSFLAESNRTPFDFSERESELVSGFNTELGGRPFAFCFIGEYISLLFIRFLFCFIFISKNLLIAFLLRGLYRFFLVAVRCLLPRFRYDKLIYFCWKFMLPVRVFSFFYYRCFFFTKM